ncbi:adenylate/guanylate cyclase domain-containing protein [Geminicoccus harenae]|uniref:adenylate/guanylate cyclase domain-containing protein n=1 Tax=Geminicoccus harenae TaxID=2498453 RepID=UPI00168B03EF|nr:adenylate/guanylate cyclase domain-containing protein [Geminicoccus harenae]
MRLPPALSFLVDEATGMAGADRFLATLGAKLLAGGLPLAGGALTELPTHPIIAQHSWLWRADTGMVIEGLGFSPAGPGQFVPADAGQEWLAGLGQVHEAPVGATARLGWATSHPLRPAELRLLREVARFAVAPLAVLAARATQAVLLETYLGKRSAARVLAGRLRREPGEIIQAALLYADLRGFTELSETSAPSEVIATLDAWFDRIAGAVHAFGGEVLKFIGDGILAIFPIGQRDAPAACDAAMRAVAAARAGMDHLDHSRAANGLPPLPFGTALHVGEMLWGNIGTADRLDFTAIGPPVNLVSRLEGLCRPLGQPVLLSGAFAAETSYPSIPLGRHRLRGIAEPCAVFGLPP